MNDQKDNVIPLRRLKLREGGNVDEGLNQQRRREREDGVIARASEIREWVSGFHGRLPPDVRIQLAIKLGRMLHGNAGLSRGDLTKILVAAGISEKTDNTKRLPRYATRPGRETPSPKQLAAKPSGYLRIVEELAQRTGANPDKAVLALFAGVTATGTAEQDEGLTHEVTDFMPLYRLILAVGDGAAKATKTAAYFEELGRKRWISAIDVLTRDMGTTPWPLPHELHREEPPEISGVWLVDVNEFAPDPDELEFFEQRMGMLPKVALYHEDLAGFFVDVPPTARKYWSGQGAAPEFDLHEVNIRLALNLWLVIAPSAPTLVPTPYFARFNKMQILGRYEMDGSVIPFEASCAPANMIFVNYRKGDLEIGFSPFDSMHVTFSFRLQDVRSNARSPNLSFALDRPIPYEDWPMTQNPMGKELLKHIYCIDSSQDAHDYGAHLLPITPASVARELGIKRSVMDEDVEQISALVAAPFRTRASVVETMIGSALQDELIDNMEALIEKQKSESERLQAVRANVLENMLMRLSAPTQQEQGE